MANNDKLITHFKNPLLRKLSYFLFLMGFFFVPILFVASPEDLAMPIMVAILVFGTSIYFQWDGLSKIVYINGNNEFAISKLCGTFTNFNFDKNFSRLAVCETKRYLEGLKESRNFYHIALKVTRDDLVYYKGYKHSMCIPNTSSSYYISTLLIYKTKEDAIERLTELSLKGVPITTEIVDIKEEGSLYINF
jgi:hypothetical protein